MKRRIALIFVILATAALAGGTAYKAITDQGAAEKKGPGTPGIIAYTVASRPFADRMEAVGTAQAAEAATLTATASDTVTAINFEEGTAVTAGTVLIQLNDEEERAELEDAEKTATRYTELAKTNATSIAQRDSSAAALKVAQARVNDRQIIAPFDGLTGFRNVSLGDLVTPGMIVTSVYDIDPIKLEFTLPEAYLSVLKPGLEIQARTEAWPDKVFTGKISTIDPGINPATRAISLKAEIDNTDGSLKPGLLMTVSVVKNERAALSIPESAIIQQGNEHKVYVIGADKKATPQPVRIGTREAGYVEVLEGLKEGDTIVAEGLMKVRPGNPVEITKTITIDEMVDAATAVANPRKQEALR